MAANKFKSKFASSDSNAGGKLPVAQGLAKDDDKPSFAFKILSAQKTKKLRDANDVNELERLVAETLEIKDQNLDLKAALMLDYYVGALWWCKQHSYSVDQTSAFFTVIDTLIKNVADRKLSLADNLLYLKTALVGIRQTVDQKDSSSSQHGGGLHTLFDVSQAKSIVAFIDTCYIQHHTLYELVFSIHQSEHVLGNTVPIESMPRSDVHWPPPLCEAIALSSHEEYFQDKRQDDENKLLEDATEDDANAENTDELPTPEQLQHEAEVLSKLTPEQIQQVIDETCSDMLGGLEVDMADKLRLKENDVIARINQLNAVSNR